MIRDYGNHVQCKFRTDDDSESPTQLAQQLQHRVSCRFCFQNSHDSYDMASLNRKHQAQRTVRGMTSMMCYCMLLLSKPLRSQARGQYGQFIMVALAINLSFSMSFLANLKTSSAA